MARTVTRRHTNAAALPLWVAPQRTQLVEAAPDADQWPHEIKYDGYRMHDRNLIHPVDRLFDMRAGSLTSIENVFAS